ncbi:SHOCT domain-containing protein [Demequina activiva]|uniref:Membrane protein n=1 Tax=Demequina activiva TaxID=1582364 RepID=A0A919Q386_9MICO|nr:SHOCT domain-containing protein [Demequina activiva]GIG55219.1 membrane protein [Demequina activiva]
MDNFWDLVVWTFWIFIWITAIMVWFRCIWDLFSDVTLGGWGKAGWVIFLVLVPWLGALIYIIARGRSMSQRQMDAMADARARQEEYIQKVAGGSSSPAEEVAKAKALLDSGTISQQEFEALKAKALA